jgi:hypothetical protein
MPTQHPPQRLLQLRTVIGTLRQEGDLAHAVPRRAAMADIVAPTVEDRLHPVGLLMLQLSVCFRLALTSHTYKSQQAPNPSNVLGVFGLSIRTQERDLDEEFGRFGRVEKVTIVYDQRVSRYQKQSLLSITHM